jgi:hypothetical protein
VVAPVVASVPAAVPAVPTVATVTPTETVTPTAPPAPPAPPAPVKPPNSKVKGYADKAKGALSAAMGSVDLSDFTPDVLFDKIINAIMSVNAKINTMADSVNFSDDINNMPDFIIPVGAGIPIAPGFALFIIYCILDITRVTIGVTGNETGRKVLSIVVAILELIRGNWKKALLTFMGYYGMSPMLMGQLLKTYVTVIQFLSPTLQIKLPYFMFDSLKSILFGIVLSVVQLGAPFAVRQSINDILGKLSNVQKDIDEKLTKVNPSLTPRPDYFKVDFTNLNNLQSILDDPVYVCSAEHRKAVDELLASVGKEGKPAVQLLLSLMRYPHTPGMTKYLCDNKAKKSYVQLLVDEGLEREAKEKDETAATPAATPAATLATVSTATPASTPVVQPKKGGKRTLRKLRKSAHHK